MLQIVNYDLVLNIFNMHLSISCALGYFLVMLCQYRRVPAIFLFIMISCESFTLWCPATHQRVLLDEATPRGTYMRPLASSTCVCVGRVWGSTNVQPYLNWKELKVTISCFKRQVPSCMCMFALPGSNKYSSYMLPLFST